MNTYDSQANVQQGRQNDDRKETDGPGDQSPESAEGFSEKEKGQRTRAIPLSRGKFAIIDGEDYERVSAFKWSYHSMGYAQRNYKKKIILMHRFINSTPAGMDTDHINGDKLDNRKSNLRTATHAQNMRNMKPHANSSTGFKGVSRCRQPGRWRASIKSNYKARALGVFQTPEAAHSAYCAASTELHKEFSRTK